MAANLAAASGAEAARVHAGPLVAQDAYTRLLHRLEPDAATLWQQAQDLVMPRSGVLVLDNTTFDKPYVQQTEQVVDLLTLLWNDRPASPGVLPPLRQSHGRADQK